jgi:hypothetical protein
MRRNAIVLLVVLIVCVAAAEMFLRSRAASDRGRIRARMGERGLCTQPSKDRRLLYTYTPGQCGANSLGYRDTEHSIEKPEGVFRIVLIGDSVAEGRDVEADSAFGRVLERKLNARGDGRRYEVILLAHIGYSTSQEIVLLEDTAFRYHPDLILWSYCLNDPAHPVYHNANGDLGRYYHRPRSYLVARAEAFAFRVKQKYRGLECPTEFHAFVHCAFWPEVEESLKRIGEITLNHRVPVVFVIHPIFEKDSGFEDYSLRDVHVRLAEAARANGFDVVDLLEPFRAYAPAGLKIESATYYDPWHMNGRGHRVAATAIAPHIP